MTTNAAVRGRPVLPQQLRHETAGWHADTTAEIVCKPTTTAMPSTGNAPTSNKEIGDVPVTVRTGHGRGHPVLWPVVRSALWHVDVQVRTCDGVVAGAVTTVAESRLPPCRAASSA